jgi:photosystem II stability/assembly factor-like uncharacterized protein
MQTTQRFSTPFSCLVALLVGPLLGPAACTDEDDDDTDSSGSGSDTGTAWLVGADGTMVRIDGEQSRGYPLDATVDLRAIACRGAEEAWAVGRDGTAWFTLDGGDQWAAASLPTDADLSAVALDAAQGVWIAGEDGTVMRSPDGGGTWLDVGGDAEWTGISTTAAGELALLSAADGTIWRHDGAAAQRVFSGTQRLAGVAIAPDGARAAAVGTAGTFVTSDDGGATFTGVAVDTARDLHAVWVAHEDEGVFAVGDAGVFVNVGPAGTRVEELLAPELALRDVHLSADHAGHIVGDHGVVLATHDMGAHWTPVDAATTADLAGIDVLHGEPHL